MFVNLFAMLQCSKPPPPPHNGLIYVIYLDIVDVLCIRHQIKYVCMYLCMYVCMSTSGILNKQLRFDSQLLLISPFLNSTIAGLLFFIFFSES